METSVLILLSLKFSRNRSAEVNLLTWPLHYKTVNTTVNEPNEDKTQMPMYLQKKRLINMCVNKIFQKTLKNYKQA